MNDRKKDVGATQSTKFRVGAGTKVVVQVNGYLPTEYEHYNFYFIWYFIDIKAHLSHTQKWTLGQVHPNRMKFSGYVEAMVERLC